MDKYDVEIRIKGAEGETTIKAMLPPGKHKVAAVPPSGELFGEVELEIDLGWKPPSVSEPKGDDTKRTLSELIGKDKTQVTSEPTDKETGKFWRQVGVGVTAKVIAGGILGAAALILGWVVPMFVG